MPHAFTYTAGPVRGSSCRSVLVRGLGKYCMSVVDSHPPPTLSRGCVTQLEINLQHARKSVSSTRSKTKILDKAFECRARPVSLISLCPSSELQKASYWDFLYVIRKYQVAESL